MHFDLINYFKIYKFINSYNKNTKKIYIIIMKGLIVMKYIPIWYNQETVVKEDAPIEAASMEEARDKAYIKYNGNPPAPLLSLKEVGC